MRIKQYQTKKWQRRKLIRNLKICENQLFKLKKSNGVISDQN
jgi:hypothetical protein